MTPEQVDDFKNKVQKETIESVIKTIEINDSYFYASMTIMEMPIAEDPFQQKVKALMRINLFNSKEFKPANIVNDKKALQGKLIKSEVTLDKNLVNQKEDLMMLVYEEVSKEIAKDLFQENARNIHMAITERDRISSGRTYI